MDAQEYQDILDDLLEKVRCYDELDPPTLHSQIVFGGIANVLDAMKIGDPSSIVPNGDGGICFEWHSKDRRYAISLEVMDDGKLDLVIFEDCKIVFRFDGEERTQ